MTASPQRTDGRRRSLDATVQLVPFIDLLSCCIAFLLITAVWSSTARLEVSPAGAEPGPVREPQPTLTLCIEGDGGGFVLRSSTGQSRAIAAEPGRLAALLGETRAALPELREVTVQPADAVSYERIVAAMDALRAARFEVIAVEPAQGG